MLNSELLKSSIADAKAVRYSALANAKAMLEESFSKQVREMFADKLRNETTESDDESVEEVDEVSAPNNVSKGGKGVEAPATKDVSKGQPKKVSDANTNFKTVHMGQGPTDVPKASDSIMKETAEEGAAEENVEEAGLTSEELDEIIQELESEIASEEGTDGVPPSPEDPTQAPVVPTADTSADAAPVVPPVPAPAPCPPVAPVPGAPVPPAPVAPGVPGAPAQAQAPGAPVDAEIPGEETDEINLEELIRDLSEETEKDEEDKETMDEAKDDGVPKNVGGQDAHKSPLTYPKKTSNDEIEAGGKNHNVSGKGNIGSGEVGGLQKENAELKAEINECVRTIEYLRSQINEVNLLNAKLLYSNKLFKNANLDDSQKRKIVESFDLTKNVREVKLMYAALFESLNFSGRKATTKPAVKSASTVAQSITEGLASKTVASTKPSTKEIISEGTENQMANRFRRLAGIPQPKAKK